MKPSTQSRESTSEGQDALGSEAGSDKGWLLMCYNINIIIQIYQVPVHSSTVDVQK